MLNVLDAIEQHPEVMRPLFCHKSVKLTAAALENLFHPQLSVSDSNLRAAENVVYAWWLDYLQQLEGCACMNHDLNLAISKACQLPEIRVMLAAATDVALFFKYSPKEQTCLEGIIADVNVQCAPTEKIWFQKVKTLSETRWV